MKSAPDVNWLENLDKLSDEERDSIERPLTMNELSNVIFKHLKVGKSPGNDGLTVEYIVHFGKR